MSRIVLGLASAPRLFVGSGLLLVTGSILFMEIGGTYEPFLIARPVETMLFVLGLTLTVTGCAFLHRALGPIPRTLGTRARAWSRFLGAALVAAATFAGYLLTVLCSLGCSTMDHAHIIAYAAAPAMLGIALVTVSIPRMPWDRVPVVA